MAIRSILLADNPALRRKSKRIKRFDSALQGLVTDMVDTMHAAHGLGLAAPQIGVPLRLIIIELPEDEENPRRGQLIALCNPEITRASGEEEAEEGCLSVPDYVGDVVRATKVTVKGQTPTGKATRLKADGLLARALQHEIDHLDGILFLDRLESLDKLRRVPPREVSHPTGNTGEGSELTKVIEKVQLPEVYQKDVHQAVEILKEAGCTHVFLFGSLAVGEVRNGSDIDLAIRGCPKGRFFPLLGRLLLELDHPVDLVNLDRQDAFARYLEKEGELLQIG